jgi:hypothetical protein
MWQRVRVERQRQSIDGQHDREETECEIGDDFHERPHRDVMLENRHHSPELPLPAK